MKIRVRVSNEFERCSSLQMGLRDNIHLVLFLVFLLFLCLIPPVSSQPWDGFIVIQEDYQALREFKRELDYQNVVLRSWNDSGYGACSGGWLGIKCVKGQVIAIQLPRKGLRGRITEKIGQLTALRKLSLHDNSIGGSIPYSLGFLINLRGVYLFNNRLIGSIPPNIGNSPLLQAIDFSNNSLTGKIPDNISRSTKLYRINLSFNGFSGRIPVGLTTSPSLNFLSLEHNNLSGPIPDTWGGSTGHGFQLLSVNLNHNFLSGKIPSSISRLAGLEEINLGNNQINGSIPIEIGVLSRLKTLDFSHNFIGGALPTSICNLSSLVELKLDNNMIENHIPSDIDKLQNLSVLSLKRNRMDGQIPEKLGNLSKLKELDLSENKLTGGVTTFSKIIANLEFFNVSYNNLSGPVPLALAEKFNSSSFTGNIQLCGYNISVPCVTVSPPSIQNPAPSTPVESPRRKLGVKDIILIVAGCLLAILLVICLVLLFCLIRRRTTEKKRSDAVVGEKAEIAAGKDGEGGGDAGGKLVHFDGPFVFTADDLLCATAEIMGKSTYGTVYKATLEDGNQVAVKRLREKIAKNLKEFEAEVNTLGKIRHSNLLSLRAYYLGPKGEKLLVYDYMPKGSLASLLHARGPESPVNWHMRMKIALGATKGLLHLHTQENIIHGNLTSGNILIDENNNSRIADFGLSRLMTAAANSNVIATATALGYRAPELSKIKKANTKTDVYSLGVIILELLTGKSPGETMNGRDLPQWVASVVKEEWKNEVFDLELMKEAPGSGDEMLNTLKLALHCVDPSPASRPEVQQIYQQLMDIRPDVASALSGEDEGQSSDTPATRNSGD